MRTSWVIELAGGPDDGTIYRTFWLPERWVMLDKVAQEFLDFFLPTDELSDRAQVYVLSDPVEFSSKGHVLYYHVDDHRRHRAGPVCALA